MGATTAEGNPVLRSEISGGTSSQGRADARVSDSGSAKRIGLAGNLTFPENLDLRRVAGAATRELPAAPHRRRQAPQRTSDSEVWEHVARWVSENRGLIARNAERIYAGYAPYDLADYLQQATIAAFYAWKDCVRAGEPERFVAYLFVRFRREVKDEMGIRRDAPASLRLGDACRPAAEPPTGTSGVREEGESKGHTDRRRELLWKALRWMTPKQRVAWLLATGHLGHGEADAKGIGRALKIGRRAASRLLARGMERAALCAAEEAGR